MKLTALLLVTAILQVSARTYAQKITLTEKNAPLDQIFEKISDQTGYDFLVSTENIQQAKPVTIKIQNAELKTVLDQIFSDQPLNYVIQEKMIVISKKDPPERKVTTSVPVTVTGKVTDTAGAAIPGVTIRIISTDKVAFTDADGKFSIIAEPGAEIRASFVGYEPYGFIVKNNQSFHSIVLHILRSQLNELQVIGYGKTSRRFNTGNVSTVTAQQIAEQPVTNVLSALIGRAPGVFVQTTNGLPGGAVTIQIRGKGSIAAGTDPLYIIDGVPYPSSVVASNNILGQSAINGAVSPLNSLNPSDIESISILKDADATTIYGSRGSNGVVLITTKKGKAGKTEVGITLSQGISQVASLPQLLSNEQYLQIRREAYRNDGRTPSADPNEDYAPDLMVWDTTKSTDWRKFLLGRTGHVTNAQGTISGGSKNTTFMIGGNYHSETTVLPGDNLYKRGGINANIQHTSDNQKFYVQFSTSYTADNNQLSNLQANFLGDLLLPPDFPLYDKTGGYNYYLGWNPLADLSAVSKTSTDNIVINSLIRYTLTRGLDLKISTGFNKLDIGQVMTYPTNAQYQGSNNFTNFGNNSSRSLIIEPQLTYLKTFSTSELSLLAGATYQQSERESLFTQASNFSSDLLLENISSATSFSHFNTTTNYKYLSAFGRINYKLKDRYLVNVSIRRDGSSRFGPGNEFGNFGALGAAWIFSEEDWIKAHLPFLSYGKLRGSYGLTGNDQITDYQYLSAYSSFGGIYQGTATLQPSRIANADFHWETTKKLEIGLELGFLKDQILFNISRYRNRTSDQLVNYAIPSLTGFASYQANLPAEVENSGWEFELSTKNIAGGNFRWSTSFNLTLPQNKLLSFPGLATSSYANTLVVGEPITRVYGYRFAGIDPTGAPLFAVKAGGSSTQPLSIADQSFTLGKGYPDLYGGIGNKISYKSWTLDVFGQFAKQSGVGGLLYTPGILSNGFSNILDRWQNPGDQSGIPKSSNSFAYYSTYRSSSANYFNTSYFRIKNVALSYSLPATWLKRNGIQQLSIFLQGQNLYTFWNSKVPVYDPESGAGSSIPPMKTLIAGIQLTF